MSAPAATTPAADQILIGGLSLAWIEQVATTARNYGHALRPGVGPWIEAQSINNGLWYPLSLENRKEGDVLFASIADRDAALAEIQTRAARSFFTDADRAQATATLTTMAAIAAR